MSEKTQTVRFYEPVKYNLEVDLCTNTACRAGDKTVFACLANNSEIMDIISHSMRRAGLMSGNGQQYYQALLFYVPMNLKYWLLICHGYLSRSLCFHRINRTNK